MNKLRVLVLTERFSPEPFLVGELVEAFTGAGMDLTVLTQVPSYPDDRVYPGYTNKLYQQEYLHGARILRIATVLGYKSSKIKKILNYLWFMIATTMTLVLTGSRYDAVFVYHTGPLTQAFPLLLVRGAKGRRVLWTQDVWPDTVFEYGFPSRGIFARLLKSFVRLIYGHVDHLCITSPGFREAVEPYASPSTRVHYQPQWAPQALLDGIRTITPPVDFGVFRFAGTLGTMQNLEKVMEGFALAHEEYPHITLELLGDGSERERLMALATSRGWDFVCFPGRVPMEQVAPRLQAAHALVLPLTGHGVVSRTIPAKFQAYLAAGRPVLAMMQGTVPDLVEEHGLGLTADPHQVADMARAFVQAASLDPGTLGALGRRGTEYLEANFDKVHIVDSFVSMLRGKL